MEQFQRFGAGAAVVQKRGYRREKRTYSELRALALAWSALLAERGIGTGDRVLLWGANSVEWIASFWAVQLRGAIAVPMDAGASREFVQKTIRDAGVKLILQDRGSAELELEIPALLLEETELALKTPRAWSRKCCGW